MSIKDFMREKAREEYEERVAIIIKGLYTGVLTALCADFELTSAYDKLKYVIATIDALEMDDDGKIYEEN